MTGDLARLLRPASIAVIGGGAWCEQVVRQASGMGYAGAIWPVHPRADTIAGLPAFACMGDLPGAPDAVFIGVNRDATVGLVRDLAQVRAGGAVCFASGFAEARAEDARGDDLQAQLVAAAGDMPILGPNCYGFINALDGALLWPDQHGCARVDRGVAILTQSSNIAINLTMQKRALPIAYTITCGNMAQTSQAQIATALLDDPRVTAIGLHIEGFSDLRAWEALAQKAHAKGVPLVAIKVGASDQAQVATVSHTASLAGSDAGAQAFLDRLGIARVGSLPAFIETLKLLHCAGPLTSKNIASISCSGGEASLIADMAMATGLTFPPLTQSQRTQLAGALGPMVALNNPLDYHTYIWRDHVKMAAAWAGMTGPDIAMTFSIVDYPTTDATDWECATQAALDVRAQTGAHFAMVASLPELMPLDVAARLMTGGVVPFMGIPEALAATHAAAQIGPPDPKPVLLPSAHLNPQTLDEATAKAALAAHGVPVPANRVARDADEIAQAIVALSPPYAVKGVGLAHKSEHGAVRLGVAAADVTTVAAEIGTDAVLIEEMAPGGVAELLIGVTCDPAHGFVLTLGAGGVLTEVLRDTVSMLVPADGTAIETALNRLRCAPLLLGYRRKPAANLVAIVDTVQAVQSYVVANADSLAEVEINPLICTPDGAIAVDALIPKDHAMNPIKTETRDGILLVTLDRPKANAIDLATSRIMGDTFAAFRDDPALRVAIITGAGAKFFCPGWDLKAAADGDAVDGDYGVGGFGGLQELPDLNKPVIAAVNGIACGGGLELALSADMIIAADHATFALPEIRSGTVADAASVKLPKRIPYHIAMELLLTGRWFDASEAKGWGLVNEIVPADQLMDRAWELARLLASGPPLVYAAIKEIVRDAEDSKFQDAMTRITGRQLATVDVLYGSEDNLEGARAFAEKRDPVWKGK